MKIQCDVCNKEAASLYCSADEAALCKACDHRVHHANKLASKHHRLPLLNPTAESDNPRCDICQERRAFLFCREDKALLCRECDIPIHTANEYTKKHNRFLLTGVKIGAPLEAASCLSKKTESQPPLTSKKEFQCITVSTPPPPPPPVETNTCSNPSSGGSTSSIGEYLTKTLPGWHVEDFLELTSAPCDGFSMSDNLVDNFSCDDTWVPNIPPYQLNQINELQNRQVQQMNVSTSTSTSTPAGMNKRWRDHHNYAVPQMSTETNKRNRYSC